MSKTGNWADMENSSYWYSLWINACMDKLKPAGFLAFCINWRSFPVISMACARTGRAVSSLLVWDKLWIGPASMNQLRPRYEFVVLLAGPEARIKDRSVPDIFACKWQAGHRNNLHSAEKPVALLEHLIKHLSPARGVILDPFMGSGSTGAAALNLGRRFVGIESEPRILEIASQRLKSYFRGTVNK
jgi:site-specific DNA-methyltransferase (adenine-specific)